MYRICSRETKKMAILPWTDAVRKGGELRLFPKDTISGTKWADDLDSAISTFNRLLTDKAIQLVFKKVDTINGAHVTAEVVPGNAMEGKTEQVPKGHGRWMDWAHIRLPMSPRIDGTSKSVEVARPVRLWILVHELIHCVGLSNEEHSGGDVFMASLAISPVGPGGKVLPADGSQSVPPITLGAATITNLKKAWEIAPDKEN